MSEPERIPPVTVERTGPKSYVARNDRGAEVAIGSPGAEGSFTPVELLQAAVAGCTALSAEAQLAYTLGEDFAATATIEGFLDADDNRIEKFVTEVNADMSGLAPERREKLIASAERFISRLCTVKRTLEHGTENVTEVRGEV